jgi:hypothetical protein
LCTGCVIAPALSIYYWDVVGKTVTLNRNTIYDENWNLTNVWWLTVTYRVQLRGNPSQYFDWLAFEGQVSGTTCFNGTAANDLDYADSGGCCGSGGTATVTA